MEFQPDYRDLCLADYRDLCLADPGFDSPRMSSIGFLRFAASQHSNFFHDFLTNFVERKSTLHFHLFQQQEF
jgi:hypothetical protein